jgi:hypothetical protein
MLGRMPANTAEVYDEREEKILDPHLTEDKIQIYERQVKEWFLDPAGLLLRLIGSQASFVVLSICLSYLEGFQQYKQGLSSYPRERSGSDGEGGSKDFFVRAFMEVFSDCDLEEGKVRILYKQARCGLFHNGMTGNLVNYDMEREKAFSVEDDGYGNIIFYFQPEACLAAVKAHFNEYIFQGSGMAIRLSRWTTEIIFSTCLNLLRTWS